MAETQLANTIQSKIAGSVSTIQVLHCNMVSVGCNAHHLVKVVVELFTDRQMTLFDLCDLISGVQS